MYHVRLNTVDTSDKVTISEAVAKFGDTSLIISVNFWNARADKRVSRVYLPEYLVDDRFLPIPFFLHQYNTDLSQAVSAAIKADVAQWTFATNKNKIVGYEKLRELTTSTANSTVVKYQPLEIWLESLR